jgi:crotonobetainyl-CoA:carnitine CoA-transferase CaiB-like acyl-CoA transferase
VLDLTRFVAGPYATMLLADSGAEVVKVEPIGGEETRGLDPMIETPSGKASGYFHRFNRTKKSICVDYRTGRGRDVILRLAPHFDVFVENFRPGVLDRLGLGYAEVSKVAPRVVYCTISGYGHTPGPRRDDPMFAILAEVSAGVVGRGVRPDDPPVRLSAPLGDLYPASLAVAGICMALLQRQRTGQGTHVDMSMYDALVSLNENAITMSATTGKEMLPTGRLSYAAPFGVFQTRTGYICIAVLGEPIWRRFCDAIGRPDLAADASLSSGTLRSQAMDAELGTIIARWLESRSRDDVVTCLVDKGVPAGIVATPFDVIDSPQTAARHLIWDVPSYTGGTVRSVGSPIRVGGSGFQPVGPVPGPGQHTADVLADIGGYGEDEVKQLIADGTVQTWA